MGGTDRRRQPRGRVIPVGEVTGGEIAWRGGRDVWGGDEQQGCRRGTLSSQGDECGRRGLDEIRRCEGLGGRGLWEFSLKYFGQEMWPHEGGCGCVGSEES
jgi:hypothetical protein